MKGKKIKYEEPGEEEDTGVLDLMSRLRESLEQGSGGKKAKRSAPKAEPDGDDEAEPVQKKAKTSRKRKTA